VASDVASAALLGAGVSKDLKNAGHRVAKVAKAVAKTRVGQSIERMAIDHGSRKIAEATGSELAGRVARNVGNRALDKLAGDGIVSFAKRIVGRVARSKAGKAIGKMAIEHGSRKIAEVTGSELAGRVARTVGNKALEKAAGGGILDDIRRVGRTAGKAFPINPFSAGEYVGEHYVGPAIISSMKGGALGGSLGGDFGVGGRRVSFHDGEPLWRYAARHQSGGSFKPL
jgi:hypothetical protein